MRPSHGVETSTPLVPGPPSGRPSMELTEQDVHQSTRPPLIDLDTIRQEARARVSSPLPPLQGFYRLIRIQQPPRQPYRRAVMSRSREGRGPDMGHLGRVYKQTNLASEIAGYWRGDA
ncbi:unnamed protein product [Arctogadus glacialis]